MTVRPNIMRIEKTYPKVDDLRPTNYPLSYFAETPFRYVLYARIGGDDLYRYEIDDECDIPDPA